jgi:hypothetical protein
MSEMMTKWKSQSSSMELLFINSLFIRFWSLESPIPGVVSTRHQMSNGILPKLLRINRVTTLHSTLPAMLDCCPFRAYLGV